MKQLLFVITIFLFTTSLSNAQPSDRPLLRVQLKDHSPITVSVDGRFYYKHGTSLTIGDLPQGRHRIKVYTYAPGRHKAYADLVYEGVVKVHRGTFNNMVVDADRGTMRLYTRDLADADFSGGYRQHDKDFGGDDMYRNYNNKPAQSIPPVAPANLEASPVTAPNDYKGGTADNTVSQKDMNGLKKNVADRLTDTDKMKLMESVLQNRSYYTEQVRTMLSWLSFESSRLDFAKWAYGHAIDKNNYWKLESEFEFSSSKDELQSFIRSAR